MSNETISGLKRVSWLPDRDASENGNLIAGQDYFDVYITGGVISGITPSDLPDPLAIADGGTGQTTANAALNALLPDQSTHTGEVLKTDGTDTYWSSDVDTGITQLTGDVTAGPGSGSQGATLATVNSNVGSFTNASLTVNGKGLITAASSGTAPVTSVSGTSNRITSTGGATPVIDISGSYVGQSSITTLGTITTGVWNGTDIANANLADMATGTIKTNITGGAAAPTDTTLTQIIDALCGSSQGSIISRNSSIWTAITPGTIGQKLYSGGAGAQLAWGDGAKVGSSTRDVATATGTQAITGVGFSPKLVIIFGSVNASIKGSVGAGDGTGQACMIFNPGGAGAGFISTVTTAVAAAVTDASNNNIASLTSLDADGFTLTWTKTGSPTGTFTYGYIAIR